MKFAIITHAEHKIDKQEIFAYEPYVREMNLWLKYVDEVKIVAPFSSDAVSSIESEYQFTNRHSDQRNEYHPESVEGSQDSVHKKQIPKQHFGTTQCKAGNDEIELIPIPSFDVTSFKNGIKAIFRMPKILIQIYKAMQWADHIHLRCPGNIGLLGCFVQILFPNKQKTVKYAGNFDSKSKQPLSYKLQRSIVSNTFLTRNCKVLVYGEWPNQSKNIVPFFTASYSEEEILDRHSQHDKTQCHPEPVEGSHDSGHGKQMLNQVQQDGTKRHSVPSTE